MPFEFLIGRDESDFFVQFGRFVPLWAILFFAGSLVFLLLLQRAWQRRGGVASYIPPGSSDNAPSNREKPPASS